MRECDSCNGTGDVGGPALDASYKRCGGCDGQGRVWEPGDRAVVNDPYYPSRSGAVGTVSGRSPSGEGWMFRPDDGGLLVVRNRYLKPGPTGLDTILGQIKG